MNLEGVEIKPAAEFKKGRWYPSIAIIIDGEVGDEVMQFQKSFKRQKEALNYATRKIKKALPNLRLDVQKQGCDIESNIPDDI